MPWRTGDLRVASEKLTELRQLLDGDTGELIRLEAASAAWNRSQKNQLEGKSRVRTIKKFPQPAKLTGWRTPRLLASRPPATQCDYESLRYSPDVLEVVENGLLTEQGGICAYTGHQISIAPADPQSGANRDVNFHIEHLTPKNSANMVRLLTIRIWWRAGLVLIVVLNQSTAQEEKTSGLHHPNGSFFVSPLAPRLFFTFQL